MKKLFLFLFFVVCYFAQSQHTISGIFSPADDYSWLIAYRIKPGSQAYVADTSIKDGKFALQIPENALPGTYRLVYAVPQDEFYFDLLFNGKEDINFDFKTESVVTFTASHENILFSMYFKEIQEAEQNLINFYTSGKTDSVVFTKLTEELGNIQKSYENKSEGLLVSHFIKANHPYIPSEFQSAVSYIQNKKKNYLYKLNFEDSVLQGTEFLTNKLANFVFSALPPRELSYSETEKTIQDNVKIATEKLKGLSKDYRFYLHHSLWEYASALKLYNTADFLFNDFLKSESLSEENQEKLNQIEINTRLRVGQIAPEIEWKSNNELKKLSALEGASHYILVFWSSRCSHCLKELPALHKELKTMSHVKVVAIGLEDEETNWKFESGKLTAFEHTIALGKWESSYAKLYDIHATPTYFILDSDKKIIAKPESNKGVVKFLKN